MVMSTGMQYNGASTQSYIVLRCPRTGKILGKVSHTGIWPDDLKQWLWCRGCHMEHEVTSQQVKEARAQDANTQARNRAPMRETINSG